MAQLQQSNELLKVGNKACEANLKTLAFQGRTGQTHKENYLLKK